MDIAKIENFKVPDGKDMKASDVIALQEYYGKDVISMIFTAYKQGYIVGSNAEKLNIEN